MLKPYHVQITTQALKGRVGQQALGIIIASNIRQDDVRGQIGHPEYHFDNNAFEQSYAYMEAQRAVIVQTLAQSLHPLPAWQAFGRLTHTAQDFYAHSNYISLWASQFPKGQTPPASAVTALQESLLAHPDLHTGRIYFGEVVLWMLPFLRNLLYPRLPVDSHAKMNLDHPARSPLFPHALEAARQRTIHEFELMADRIHRQLDSEAWKRFTGI